MRSFAVVLTFIALTFLCWGAYGPTLHIGQHDLGSHGQLSSLKPFICVGVAYFLIAVLVPMALLYTRGEKGEWTFSGTFWSLAAGGAGAIGALGIILAFKFKGSPVYVMPLVFGLAPVVNTFTTMFMTRTIKEAGAIFYAGVAVVAIGAAGVLVFNPTSAPASDAKEEKISFAKDKEGENEITPDQIREQAEENGHSDAFFAIIEVPQQGAALEHEEPLLFDSEEDLFSQDKDDTPHVEEVRKTYLSRLSLPWESLLMIPLSIGLTALCWGCYGPVLHKGQGKMEGSRLRPFMCVGLAYFAIAVVAPLPLFGVFTDASPESWTGWVTGIWWSVAAGAVGAIGALGIIMAFNFGGKPIYVMPLVFGCAPVVNTFITMFEKLIAEGTFGRPSPWFFGSLLLVIAGAVTVLVFSPRPKVPGKTRSAPDERPTRSIGGESADSPSEREEAAAES